MKIVNNFPTKTEFDEGKLSTMGGKVTDLEHFTSHVFEPDNIYLKESYFIVTTSSDSNSAIMLFDEYGNEVNFITLNKGENKIENAEYGFTCYPNSFVITSFDFSNYRTDKITNMYAMFHNCDNLTLLDLSKFNTLNVTNFNLMFLKCKGLKSLDLGNFDTSKVTNMGGMFNWCSGLTSLELSNFDTSNVTDMSNMFAYCTNLNYLDISNFNTTNVTSMSSMFYYCNKLSHIKCKQSFKDWCIANQDTIYLPTAMREGGSGTWEIVPSIPS